MEVFSQAEKKSEFPVLWKVNKY